MSVQLAIVHRVLINILVSSFMKMDESKLRALGFAIFLKLINLKDMLK